jgi:dTDP-4-amino-4,6-dideoxygalactose transaminase
MSYSAETTRLAVDGGSPVRTAPFPKWPVYGAEEEKALLDVLHSGVWGIGGEAGKAFSERFAAFQNAKHCVLVPNGTIALEVALHACGISYGDEVIVPPYTFVATASAVLTVGAIPVFADVDPDTYLLDAGRTEALINERTKAIIPVHVAGCPADLDAFKDIARRHNLIIIEDACQAHGAAWNGRRVGAIGNIGAFSFQSSKNITAGEGGAVVGDDDELMEAAWSYHNVGRVRSGRWYQHERLGSNARISEWQAAILLAQMPRVEQQMALREKNAALLNQMLSEIPGIRPMKRDPRVTTHAYHLYMFRYDGAAFGGKSRADFIGALTAEGIPCSSGYVPLYRENAVIDACKKVNALVGREPVSLEENIARCPVTERICAQEAVWLTQNMLLATEQDMHDIATAISKIQRAWQ